MVCKSTHCIYKSPSWNDITATTQFCHNFFQARSFFGPNSTKHIELTSETLNQLLM